MKIRYILPNDKKETIAAHQKLLLEANPDCELDSININPLKKNEQREGEFEVDFVLKHKDEKLVENQIKKGLEQAEALVKQREETLSSVMVELNQLEKDKKELEKQLKAKK